MTKTDIDLTLQEFHDQLHIPLLEAVNAVYKASPESKPESLSDAVRLIPSVSGSAGGDNPLCGRYRQPTGGSGVNRRCYTVGAVPGSV
jgi:hypothetical protein